MAELNGPRTRSSIASRQRVGVHERTFLQSTPMGDLVIVTVEGDDPGQAFGKLMAAKDAFSTWFIARASAVHGFDPSVVDGRAAVGARRRLGAGGRPRRADRRSHVPSR